jgi:hypothetical protein
VKNNSLIGMVDLTKRPLIYRTDNPNYYGRICIDLFPSSLPSICSFASTVEVAKWLKTMFGESQFKLWFPGGIREVQAN